MLLKYNYVRNKQLQGSCSNYISEFYSFHICCHFIFAIHVWSLQSKYYYFYLIDEEADADKFK